MKGEEGNDHHLGVNVRAVGGMNREPWLGTDSEFKKKATEWKALCRLIVFPTSLIAILEDDSWQGILMVLTS